MYPKIRFKDDGGNDFPHWEEKSIDEIANFRRGSFPQPYGLKKWYNDENGFPFIQVYDVDNNFRLKEKTKRLISELAKKQSVFVPKGSIVITIQGSIGRIAITQYDAYCDRTLLIFTDFKIPIEKYFFIYALFLRFEIEARIAVGGTIKTITKEKLKLFPINLPSLPEQTKIADFLTSVDKRIEHLTQKKSLLEQYKKGAMQQLFTQAIRFKDDDGNDFPDWEEKCIESFSKVIRGASPRPKGDPRYYKGNIPRLMGVDVTRDGKWVTPTVDSLTEEGAKLSRFCEAGTLTIVCSGTVGVVSFLSIDACIHDGFLALVEIDERAVYKDFLYHRLSTLREQFEKGATHGGVFTNLTTTGVKEFQFQLPTLPEQTKIADFLTAIDSKIESVANQITETQTFKKGLLQQLFV